MGIIILYIFTFNVSIFDIKTSQTTLQMKLVINNFMSVVKVWG